MTSNTIDNDRTMSGGEGTLLANRYRIIRQLGQGGMGSVWLAEDTQLDNKQFAIKMLPSILVSNKRAYAQLKSEALVAMKLVHPNIVQIRAFEENDGNPFLVMDYIDGQTLDDYLAEKGNREWGTGNGRDASTTRPLGGLPEDEVVRILKPIALALDYAHSQGVVHRDVKPSNIMIRKDGVPFILDFGISREMQETMTRVTGKLSSGTLLYMSPEQLNGDAPKAAQDIYSFAAMAYECMSGHPPFYRGAIEDQIKNKEPEPLVGRVDPNAPQSIASSIMAGLTKKPEDRPPNCAGVLSGDASTQSRRDAEGQRAGSSRAEHVERVEEGRASLSNVPDSAAAAAGGATPKASEQDAARARVEAKLQQRRIARLPEEFGVAERKTMLEEQFVKAELFFESRLWRDALSAYSEYARQCEGLEKHVEEERKRQEAEAKAEEERKRREAEAMAEEERKRQEEEARAVAEQKRRGAEAESKRIGPPSGTVKTIMLPGGVEMRMRWCRPGTFMMGSPKTETGRSNDEKQHRVTLTHGFWMGETPVTQRQWRSVMGFNPSYFRGDDFPVEQVSWEDCQKFVGKVNMALQCRARLPTEAEWEYACRAGTVSKYGGTGNLDEMGWYGNKFFGFGLKPHPVGKKLPNAYGLYDMHGNVYEWCSDYYGGYTGDVIDPRGPRSGVNHVLRGGSWLSNARYCRSAFRSWDGPGYCRSSVGFRLCCSELPCE